MYLSGTKLPIEYMRLYATYKLFLPEPRHAKNPS